MSVLMDPKGKLKDVDKRKVLTHNIGCIGKVSVYYKFQGLLLITAFLSRFTRTSVFVLSDLSLLE